jgi:hypothetical protein
MNPGGSHNEEAAALRMPNSATIRAPLWLCVPLVVILSASTSSGQETPGSNVLTVLSSNTEPPTVGMEGRLEVLLPEAGLTAKVPDRRTPLLLRIAFSRLHGTLVHYDLRYIGRVPGRYDLREYLATADGRPARSLAALMVTVRGVLPERHDGWLEEQHLGTLSIFGGYRAVATVVVALWILGIFIIMRMGRKPKVVTVEAPAQQTLTFAECLRPLVERASAGQLSADDQATLERMLITHWQRRLGLSGVDSAEMITRLRQHPEAGALLRALEDWLHRPPGSVSVALEPVLAPYRDLPAEEPAEVAR